MRIGIDFDNTIVSYDALFHKVARELNLVPSGVPVNKVAVRDYLRRIGQEEHWTEMQGYVYGSRMDDALAYEGVVDFIRHAIATGHQIFIVSHKTRHPFLGPQYDLHMAAQAWIKHRMLWQGQILLPMENIFFELTKQEKLARIGACGCDAFIDDLPEILLAEGFPENTVRLLFDPEDRYVNATVDGLLTFRNWQQLAGHFNVR